MGTKPNFARWEDIGHPYRPLLAGVLASRLRAPDARELELCDPRPPAEALQDYLDRSDHGYFVAADGCPLSAFGAVRRTLLDDEAQLWMLSSDALLKYPQSVMRIARGYVNDLAALYTLYNWVHAENTVAVRWLEWLGFEIHPPAPFGLRGAPFHYFVKRS